MANKEGDYNDLIQTLINHTAPKERAKPEPTKENKTPGTNRGRPKGTNEIKTGKIKKQRHVYLDDDLYNKIKSLAKNKGLNFTQYVELILQKATRGNK